MATEGEDAPEGGDADEIELIPEETFRDGLMEKVARLEGCDYSVHVRYTEDSGIPANAQLIVKEIVDSHAYDDYYASAVSVLDGDPDEAGESVEQFFLLSVSLIADGKDYAADHTYWVEIVMDQALDADPANVTAVQFSGTQAAALNANAETDGEQTIQRINFQSEAFGDEP